MAVTELCESIKKGELSPLEVTDAYLKSISEKDGETGAFLTVTEKQAKERAEKFGKSDDSQALFGIPCAIKDNICTKGVKTTCASKMLSDFIPCYDATVMQKLEKAGAVMLGKTNMDEFAMGGSTENSAFKITRNPAAPDRVPGGSSGGSAACVAAYEAPFALGSDTGGSIRQPAAFCGVVGIKPTYGAVSRYGLIAFASSLDQIGPITHGVKDNALILSAIAGSDEKDATSIRKPFETDYLNGIENGVKGLKIGLPTEFFADGIDPEVKSAVLNATKVYESLGAEITELSMPSLKHALAAYYVISSAEASSNLARFDGVRYGTRSSEYSDMDSLYKNTRSQNFGAEVKRRIMLGTFALSSGYYDAYYKKALRARSIIIDEYAKAFEKCDVILSPVTPTPAYKIGEKTSDPVEMYLGDIYTVPVNIAGLPSLSLPCGKTVSGLPIGMQLIGKALGEKLLYRTGFAFESVFGGARQ